jgi:hypothetical protein
LAVGRFVQDKSTRKLKGTAFVEYERREDAEAAADACAKARLLRPLFSLSGTAYLSVTLS